MKVAVISQEQTSGKSTFMCLLGGIFSRSQSKNVAIMSTGSAQENMSIVDIKDTSKELRSIHVFRALLDSDAITNTELFDYGFRQGEENVFIYDVMGTVMDDDEKKELFFETLSKVPADLTLVEIKGNIKEPFNMKVINACDAVLYVFNHSKTSIDNVRAYIDDPKLASIAIRTGYVCAKYDRNVIGEKKLGTLMKMNARNIMLFPYNSVVAKKAIEGDLSDIVYNIMKGDNEVLVLRSKFLEVMQYLFDTDRFKYIRGIEEWFK